jgi:hypothetical protein
LYHLILLVNVIPEIHLPRCPKVPNPASVRLQSTAYCQNESPSINIESGSRRDYPTPSLQSPLCIRSLPADSSRRQVARNLAPGPVTGILGGENNSQRGPILMADLQHSPCHHMKIPESPHIGRLVQTSTRHK